MNARVQRLLPVDIYTATEFTTKRFCLLSINVGFFVTQAALLLDDDSLLHRHIGALGLTTGCNNVEHLA